MFSIFSFLDFFKYEKSDSCLDMLFPFCEALFKYCTRDLLKKYNNDGEYILEKELATCAERRSLYEKYLKMVVE